jgi:tetratricopeptide (TPR) repeat protein
MQIGNLVSSQGQLEHADSLYYEALAIRRSLYGDRNSLVADVLAQIADNANLGRDLRRGDSLYRLAEGIIRTVYPQGHPDLVGTLQTHGNALQRADRFADAEPLFREALELATRFSGPNSLNVAGADIGLGFTLTMLGKYTEAEAFDRDAIRIYRSMFDDKNAMVVMARDHLGDALRGEGRFAEAEPLLLAGYERFKVPNSVTKLWRGHVLTALARLYDAEGRHDEAAEYLAIFNAPPPAPASPSNSPGSTHRPP